jgi:hypothetical protein
MSLIAPDPDASAIELLRQSDQKHPPVDLNSVLQLWPAARLSFVQTILSRGADTQLRMSSGIGYYRDKGFLKAMTVTRTSKNGVIVLEPRC